MSKVVLCVAALLLGAPLVGQEVACEEVSCPVACLPPAEEMAQIDCELAALERQRCSYERQVKYFAREGERTLVMDRSSFKRCRHRYDDYMVRLHRTEDRIAELTYIKMQLQEQLRQEACQ